MTEPHRFHPDWVIRGDRAPGIEGLDSDTKGPCRDCGQPELAIIHRWQLRVYRPLEPERVAEHVAGLRALINHREEPPTDARTS